MSLSELHPWKLVTADMLTAGQVAPQARQTRRNKLISGDVNNGDAKKWSSSVQILTTEASFWPTFLRTCTVQLHRPGPKERCKKNVTDKQTSAQDWAWSGDRRVPFSDTQNACQPASSSENRVRPQISKSLNNPFKEHLRHTHSFALARSCAFGAKNISQHSQTRWHHKVRVIQSLMNFCFFKWKKRDFCWGTP